MQDLKIKIQNFKNDVREVIKSISTMEMIFIAMAIFVFVGHGVNHLQELAAEQREQERSAAIIKEMESRGPLERYNRGILGLEKLEYMIKMNDRKK